MTCCNSNGHCDPTRRKWLQFGTLALIAALIVQWGGSNSAYAGVGGRPHALPTDAASSAIREADPQAAALLYRHDAIQVEPQHNRAANQICGNCQLYSGTKEAEWGPCAIFSYRINPTTRQPYTVNAKGWCVSWGPRANARE